MDLAKSTLLLIQLSILAVASSRYWAISEPAGHRAAWMYIKHSFEQLGLHPRLWRLPRAISRWNQIQAGEIELLELKLMTCIEEFDYMLDTFNRKNLRQRVLHSFSSSKLILEVGVSPSTRSAVLNLLILGSQLNSKSQTFTGLPAAEAVAELARLTELGLVLSPSNNAAWLGPRLPTWFADAIPPIAIRQSY